MSVSSSLHRLKYQHHHHRRTCTQVYDMHTIHVVNNVVVCVGLLVNECLELCLSSAPGLKFDFGQLALSEIEASPIRITPKQCPTGWTL